MTHHRLAPISFVIILMLGAPLALAAGAQDKAAQTIDRGLESSIDVRYTPILRERSDATRATPVRVRVSRTSEPGVQRVSYIGIVAGTFDLRDYLAREDGRPLDDLQSLPIRVVSHLPQSHGLDLFEGDQSPAVVGGWNWRSNYRVLMATFTAFKEAADRYATAVSAGEEREDPTIYLQWFGAAMGTSQIDFLSADEMPKDGTRQSDQVDLIKASMATLPPESHQRHLAEFARALSLAVSRAQPDVKPKLVKQALRVVGDDPAGATLRGLDELYRDLVKDEIKLRLTIDGGDSVGTDRPFGVMPLQHGQENLKRVNSVDP